MSDFWVFRGFSPYINVSYRMNPGRAPDLRLSPPLPFFCGKEEDPGNEISGAWDAWKLIVFFFART